jgi:hypothetical protein
MLGGGSQCDATVHRDSSTQRHGGGRIAMRPYQGFRMSSEAVGNVWMALQAMRGVVTARYVWGSQQRASSL